VNDPLVTGGYKAILHLTLGRRTRMMRRTRMRRRRKKKRRWWS